MKTSSEDDPIVPNGEAYRRTEHNTVGREWRPPSDAEQLVAALDIRRGQVVAVIGVRPQLYLPSVLHRVGAQGIVQSFNTSDDPIPRFPLEDRSVDVALLAFALGDVVQPRAVLSEMRRVLRLGGQIAVADWIRHEERGGPAHDDRVSATMCERWLAALGFNWIDQKILNPSHYMILARRPPVD